MQLARALALSACLMLPAAAAHGKTHALVVGIDTYANFANLKGAVNDARELARVLRDRIDGRFDLLLDAQATRAAVLGWLQATIREAQPGDLVVFSFSGHGIADTDDNDYKDEADGLDEFLLLHAFDENEKSPGFRERIRDDELYFLWLDAEKRGIKVLFIADACHSGGFLRSVGDSGIAEDGLPYRFTRFKTRPAKPAEVPPDFKPKPEVPDNVIFLSATHESRRLKEVMIDGRPHGALSYYVARALEGAAVDADGDGYLSVAELRDYVLPNVIERSNNDQIPEMVASDPNFRLFPMPGARREKAVSAPELALLNRNTELRPKVQGARPAKSVAEADIVWDGKAHKVFNSSGDVLASGVSADGLQSAVDAGRLRAALMKFMEQGHVLPVELYPDDRLHSKGCRVRFQVSKYAHRHFTVFNIAYDGTIQFLFPLRQFNDPVRWDRSGPWRMQPDPTVSPPYGSDFVVVIASEKPLADLHGQLVSLNGSRKAGALLGVLQSALADGAHQLGIKSIFTAQEGDKCA